ncbi:MAG: nucleotidyl transferase AbiEii/AbiGii toxin family protein [Desulfurellaceae bacterium]|nr:nucleotidyl transferase AbiEii/AbiGii toxin family protein [Desulfurellaceae bacterium]
MIKKQEIRQKARGYGVPVSTIERDYAQNWLLWSLSHINMALKGGTGIRKVYLKDYRFSDDLDFTLLESLNIEKIKGLMENCVANAREESGINFSDAVDCEENDNGFKINVYFQIMQTGINKTKIKIDITKLGNEKILLPVVMEEIIHPYSDNLNSRVKVYPLEEIMAEKIRSLFQRTRPRDLYDIWHLWGKVDMESVFKIMPEKVSFKKVIIDIGTFLKRKENFKNAWENSLEHQLKILPDFEKVFSTVARRLKDELE